MGNADSMAGFISVYLVINCYMVSTNLMAGTNEGAAVGGERGEKS